MIRLLHADLYRMYSKRWIWLCSVSMMAIAVIFVIIQSTAMDYTVSIDRVIFLPMSVYGVAVAALISMFAGDDFGDGVIKNKIISGRSRASIYFSNMTASMMGCITVYILTIVTTLALGTVLFEINVTAAEVISYMILGLFTCLAYGSLYCMISMIIGSKSEAVAICMGLSFVMLFLCLHTNQILVQQEYKDGALNPHYVGGIKRSIYGFLHDFNPSGQAAQLSAMECFNKVRFVIVDFLWVFIAGAVGAFLFGKKDIK